MSNYLHSTFSFAGIEVEGFLTEDGRAWVTLTSFTKELGIGRQNASDWLSRQGSLETLNVKIGRFNKSGTAYLVSTIADYLDYRVKLGDKKALNLYSATFRADLERSIKESNGVQVTAEQHEANRAKIRQALDLARLIEFSEQSMEELEPLIAQKEALVDSLRPQDIEEYLNEVQSIWEESKARREAQLPLSVQRVNAAIAEM